ncbi:uncharacterized protein LOC124496035 isoform X1 [Dermatophagoides farinae]|uniref:Nucleolysin tiar-like protein n=1 Tax=Dermatophagoides farinae TaxID=6954 RepID=A0A9D4P0L6_DERFA|nr:oligouridylate-binding protein 1-like isoform X1 [Dermatophagoides farinae]KAH7640880.1 nucleolysin tiar-like protein [Dermatophagoides farinae]
MDSSNSYTKNDTNTTLIVDDKQSLNDNNSSFHHQNHHHNQHYYDHNFHYYYNHQHQQNTSLMHQTSGNNINSNSNSNNNNNNNNNNNGQTTTVASANIATIATGITENPRTLYVGNLDPSINENFIHTLFSPYGHIVGLKLITDNQNDLYCFIDYDDHTSAATAIATMNKRLCLDREIKVNWASNSSGGASGGQKADTSRHFHIFVGDLSPEIETQQLREAFVVFGEISDCRVVRDSHTLKSKGYGFVSFVKKQDAENAIAGMNGQWLGHRPIRTNWATRKMSSLKGCASGSGIGSIASISGNDNNLVIGPNVNNRTMKYDEVFNSSSITNCTVYCGGINNGLTEELMQKTFCRFGTIQEIRVFKDKGYAFIKFTCKEAATNAIVIMNNQEILGQTVKCSWGKESNDNNTSMTMMGMSATNSTNLNAAAVAAAVQANLAAAAASTPLIYPYGHHHQQQLSYWYQPTAFQAAAAIHGGHPQTISATQQPSAGSNHHHHHPHPHHQNQYTTVQTNATGLQYPYNHQYYSSMAAAAAAGQTPSAATAGFNSSQMAIPISAGWTTAGTLTNNSTSVQLSGAAAAAAAAAASGYPTIQGYQAQ